MAVETLRYVISQSMSNLFFPFAVQYPSAEALSAECPGLEEDDH